MKKNLLVILLPFIIAGCNTTPPSGTGTNPSPIPSTSPSSNPVKPYSLNLDSSSKIMETDYIPDNISGKINNNGDGIIIARSYAIKIKGFKPSGDRTLLNSDFSVSFVALNESGNGIVLWTHPPKVVTATSPGITPPSNSVSFFSYKKIKNFEISNELYESQYGFLENIELDSNGNGKFTTTSLENSQYVIKAIDINNYTISDKATTVSVLEERGSYKTDKNGNGISIKKINEQSFKIQLIENNVLTNKEYQLNTDSIPTMISGSPLYQLPKLFNIKIDNKGNGFISWITSNAEIKLKKIENYMPVGNEKSLGNNYIYSYYPEINIDSNGNGFIALQGINSPPFTSVRKITNYVPDDNYYSLVVDTNATFTTALGIIQNSYGDGFITWSEKQSNTDTANLKGNIFVRSFENYNVSTQNLKEYTPQVVAQGPTSTVINVLPSGNTPPTIPPSQR